MHIRPSIRASALFVVLALIAGLFVTAAPAMAGVEQGSVLIHDNSQFTEQNGVRYGKGTK